MYWLFRLEFFPAPSDPTIFSSLAKTVRRFHIEHEERVINNVLRGFAQLNVSIERE